MRNDRSLSTILDLYRGIATAGSIMISAMLALCVAALWLSMAGGSMVEPLLMAAAGIATTLLITLRIGLHVLRRRVAEADAAKRAVLAAAHRDALTDALNRSYFLESLKRHVYFGSRQTVSYLQIDMDNLKVLNDSAGHGAGDAALIHLVDTIKALLPGALVGRLGGDEFGVAIVGHGSKPALRRFGEELLRQLDEPVQINSRPVRLSATIGAAVFPVDASEPDELISKADLALYKGKRAGRHTIVTFQADMLGDERHRRFIERELRAAILLNELELHYQPIFMADGETVRSYEALVRWRHKVRGTIAPSQFIPIAEESDLIDKLGEWVLRRACRDLPGLDGKPVGINVSPAQLRRPGFAERFKEILVDCQADTGSIIVEITETVPMMASGIETANLDGLREMGVPIAIDDFGAGHASLYYLRDFSFDVIKIDRTYIANIAQNRIDEMIVSAICDIARSMPVDIVAEGIETPEQFAMLKAAGCTGFQGYYLGRPAPLEGVRKVLTPAEAA